MIPYNFHCIPQTTCHATFNKLYFSELPTSFGFTRAWPSMERIQSPTISLPSAGPSCVTMVTNVYQSSVF